MREKKLEKIENLINNNKIDEAQMELSKLGKEFFKNSEYLFLRSKVFYSKKLYYLSIDTLLIALEFDQNDKIYDLLAKIYNEIDNKELSKKISDLNSRTETINLLKNQLSGIFRKND